MLERKSARVAVVGAVAWLSSVLREQGLEVVRAMERADGVVGDAHALDDFDRLRARDPGLPLAVLIEEPTRELLNRAAVLGAHAFAAPIGGAEIASFAERVRARHRISLAAIEGSDKLSARERACLERAIERHAYKDIAAALGIGPASVHTYLRRAVARLGAQSIEELRAFVSGR